MALLNLIHICTVDTKLSQIILPKAPATFTKIVLPLTTSCNIHKHFCLLLCTSILVHLQGVPRGDCVGIWHMWSVYVHVASLLMYVYVLYMYVVFCTQCTCMQL